MGDFDKKITSLFNEHDNEIDKKKTKKDREEEERKAYIEKVKIEREALYEAIKPQMEGLHSQLESKNILAISSLELKDMTLYLEFGYEDDRYSYEEIHYFTPRYLGPPYHEEELWQFYASSRVNKSEMDIPFLPDFKVEEPSSQYKDWQFSTREEFLHYISTVVERLLAEDLKSNY